MLFFCSLLLHWPDIFIYNPQFLCSNGLFRAHYFECDTRNFHFLAWFYIYLGWISSFCCLVLCLAIIFWNFLIDHLFSLIPWITNKWKKPTKSFHKAICEHFRRAQTNLKNSPGVLPLLLKHFMWSNFSNFYPLGEFSDGHWLKSKLKLKWKKINFKVSI